MKKNKNRFDNPKMCLWALSNPWYINDMKLTLAGMRIHEKLIKKGYSDKSETYWVKLELNLYKENKNDLLEHYSHGN
jgi:hypothetical protein|tara:strand:+ start:268 stop:498 length:231 start_codon:yes stop_codon:yes gene_type:complete